VIWSKSLQWGDTTIRGRDFDQRLVDAYLPQLDAVLDKVTLHHLTEVCEEAKIKLSATERWTIQVPGIVPNPSSLSPSVC
jgi:molecular chaperone DnaK (HSP70)